MLMCGRFPSLWCGNSSVVELGSCSLTLKVICSNPGSVLTGDNEQWERVRHVSLITEI